MTKEQIASAISSLTDAGTGALISVALIADPDVELTGQFVEKVLRHCAGGHHQSREFATCAIRILNELEVQNGNT